jgi:hypothetical protein
MIESGMILYVLLFAILALLWSRVRGLSFEALLERSGREHHRVHGVLAKHPGGGAWRDYTGWLREEE